MAGPSREIVIAGDPKTPVTGEMIREVHGRFLPRSVFLLHPPGKNGKRIRDIAPYLKEMKPAEGGTAAFVCEQYTCSKPVTAPEELRQVLNGREKGTPSP